MLSRLVITFLPRSKRLLISWLHPPSAVILEPPKIKSATVSPSICHEVMGLDAMIFVFWKLSFKSTFSLYRALSKGLKQFQSSKTRIVRQYFSLGKGMRLLSSYTDSHWLGWPRDGKPLKKWLSLTKSSHQDGELSCSCKPSFSPLLYSLYLFKFFSVTFLFPEKLPLTVLLLQYFWQ